MNTLDFILIGIILLFAYLGFRRGFLQTLGSLLGIIVASIVAGRFYLWLGDLFGGSNFSKVLAFILVFALIIKLISLVFWALGKIFQVIAVIPFLQTFERVLGGVLGLTEGILILTVLTFFTTRYPFNDWLTSQMKDSVVVGILLAISYIFLPLLPEGLKKLKSII
jgi:membrane protein required for colicin V production